MPQPPRTTFTHEAYFLDDGRVLIKATCKHCCESAIVSIVDGSARNWETTHRCSEKKKPRSTRDLNGCSKLHDGMIMHFWNG